ncbi:formyltransferase [Duganella sp. Leaf126]|uniref:formyltransferase n=1 Tax=Duganella sp. Leaf126 TaxID=1736266 RepID=UPI0006FA30FE|nr:formyltransferase [Duganella sp. Leaf126]KQQ35979.1 formyltransferase [Duganella sp. Leaf126]
MSAPTLRRRAVVFAYHDVGVRCLQVLLAGGVEVALVLTHDDDSQENIWYGSVRALCREHGLPVAVYADPGDPALLAAVQAARPDLIFSFYYRRMLPASVLAVAPAYNMHGSLLPQFRGRAPVNWAVLHGATQTGATLHEMTVKPDAGAIVAQTAVPILPDDTAHQVFGKVTVAAEQTLWSVLPALLDGSAPRRANDLRLGSYFGGRTPADGLIDWQRDAQTVYNLHRAVAPPYPGAFTRIGDRVLTLVHARLHPAPAPGLAPGLAVLDGAIVGVCGDGRMLAIAALRDGDTDVSAEMLEKLLS